MDLPVLQRIAPELDELLRGGFINKIHQPLPREVLLRIRLPQGGEAKLALSADPQLGRAHLTDLRIPNPPSPPRFCSFLRAHFQGSRILKVAASSDDRVLRIEAVRGPEEARIERALILELLGRDSNIILVDRSSNRIMDCLHRIPGKEAGSRVVIAGCEYLPPQRHGRPVVSPSVSIGKGRFVPGIAMSADGRRYLTPAADAAHDMSFPSMNEAADAFFRPKLQSALLEGLRRALASPLKARLRSLDRRLTKIQADHDRAEKLASRAEEGELLKANLNRLKKGMDRIVVQDWETGEDRAVKLEPALEPVANMERIFRKAAKGKRGRQMVRRRFEQTLEEQRAVKDQLFFIESAKDVAELEEITTGLRPEPSQVKPRGGSERDAGRGPQSGLIREFQTRSGRVVLVGKSAAGNDYLVRRKAKRGDLWFHVKDWPGAHVLLTHRGKEPASAEDMEFAAGLAVDFSKAQGKGKVEVIIANVQDLGHPKRGIAGQVTVKNYKTILSEGRSSDSMLFSKP